MSKSASKSSLSPSTAPSRIDSVLPSGGDVYAVTSNVQQAIEGRASDTALGYARGIAARNQQLRIGAVNGGRPLFGPADAEADAVVSGGGADATRRR